MKDSSLGRMRHAVKLGNHPNAILPLPGGSVAYYAKQVVLPIVDDRSCRNMWGVDPVSRICAGELRQQKGICPVSTSKMVAQIENVPDRASNNQWT
jgi:hypothetical protein